jgi:hypothetical protein
MGFGFNLLFACLLCLIIPLTLISLIAWIFSKKKVFLLIPEVVVLGIIFLIISAIISEFIANQNQLKQSDIYGEYVIDRSKFSGKQADWQYEHYRFEITKDNELLFHITEKEKICKTYIRRINFMHGCVIPRIHIKSEAPNFHVIEKNPSLYRSGKSFYYVFYSPKYGNVFFKKEKW